MLNNYLKAQYNAYLISYLNQLLDIEIKNDKKEFKCPICKREESALIYPNQKTKFYCLEPACNFKGDLFDLIKKTKNPKFTDNDVASFLTHKFKIVVKDDINEILKMYSKNKFTIFPLEPESKNPQKSFMWTEKLYIDSKIWKDWADRGYNLGLKILSSVISEINSIFLSISCFPLPISCLIFRVKRKENGFLLNPTFILLPENAVIIPVDANLWRFII